MKSSSKIGIGVAVFVLLILICSTLFILHSRQGTLSLNKNKQEQTDKNQLASSGKENGDMPEETAPEVVSEDLSQDSQFLEITSGDCNSNCQEYTEKEDLNYCKQVCGLSEPTAITGGCDKLEDLDKDYCYKDLAISTKDIKICDEIDDGGIKNACKNKANGNLSGNTNVD